MKVTASKRTSDRPQIYVLVENHLVRETLVRLFQERTDFSVVGQGGSRQANEVPNSQCDIVLLDDLQTASLLRFSFFDALQATGTVSAVLIGMENDEDQFLEAVRSGVSGYLLNDASASDIISAVRAVARGEAVCPPRLCLDLIRSVARGDIEASARLRRGSTHGLTSLQQQVVSFVAKGLTNKEIASQLNLSEFTIRNHIYRIMKQLRVESRFEMVEVVRGFGYGGLA